MSQRLHPGAGKPAPAATLVDVPALLAAFHDIRPDPGDPAQRVAFGTSGHRGSAFAASFNAWHIWAITQAICDFRAAHGVDGPLYIGCDTHALSAPAFECALEVLTANGVATRISAGGEFTPTPAVSHAIIVHNRGRERGLADGIVVTPSHNPPDNGGFKYNPTHGGPAGGEVTRDIERRANAYLGAQLAGVRRLPYTQARQAAQVEAFDFRERYVADLADVIDVELLRGADVRMAVDPLGGAGVHYWGRIAERYRLPLTVLNETVDPRFAFMSLDWDGKIRMDPSSASAMAPLIANKDRYDVTVACDTDHDRHGVVARSSGLLPANAYLSVLADYLFRHRPGWNPTAALGKTVVSTRLLDRVAARLGRALHEVPVGFKWFAPGLAAATLGFGCEESAGASLLDRAGRAWSTDKDGLVPALLAGEITAREGRDPGACYARLTAALGQPHARRVDAAATGEQKAKLAALAPAAIAGGELAGEAITRVIDKAPGNAAAIGGIKVETANGWFAARPSGTEAIYKIYAESFLGEAHLGTLLAEAQRIVDRAIA